MKTYDLPIGTKFIYKDKKFVVKYDNHLSCGLCSFNDYDICVKSNLLCGEDRKDGKSVYFKEVTNAKTKK